MCRTEYLIIIVPVNEKANLNYYGERVVYCKSIKNSTKLIYKK